VIPVLFEFGPVKIYSFGVLMALGFYLGSLVTVQEFRRRGGDGERMWNLLVWVFIAGLVGSRLLSVANDPAALIANPVEQLTSGSGFVWYGGLIAGFLVAIPLRRAYQIPFTTLLDCTAFGLALGQAIGRLGCHVAGDGDWGVATSLPWGVAYKNAIVGWYEAPGVRVHPTPIYEALAYGSVYLLLRVLRRRDPPPGMLFSVYLIGTSVARFGVEFIRVNPTVAFGLTQAQLLAIALFAMGCGWILRYRFASSVAREAVR
jgi:phosphatidylglycerol:prolipoprotein diacylglycerol transferase